MYMPIKAINTFAKDWTIKARVVNKAEKRVTQNAGSLLKITLADSDGTQIEATFFKDSAEKFDKIIQQNKVYLFSDGNVKLANQKFTQVKNDFCIIFEKYARIVEVVDNMPAAVETFNFKQIASIQDVPQWKSIDICGIVAEVGQVESKNLKSGQQKACRNVVLIDDSGYAINLGLWGITCDQITDKQIHSAVAVKNVTVSDFGGKSINVSDKDSKIYASLVNQQTTSLKRWYSDLQQKGENDLLNFRNLTQKPGRKDNLSALDQFKGGKDAGEKASNVNLISEMNEYMAKQNDTDQSHFFFINCYVTKIQNPDSIFYPSCMGEKC